MRGADARCGCEVRMRGADERSGCEKIQLRKQWQFFPELDLQFDKMRKMPGVVAAKGMPTHKVGGSSVVCE